MRLVIQQGIDARPFQTLMLQLAQAGAEVDAHAARQRHEERMKLIAKSGGAAPRVGTAAQGSLFEDR